MSNEFKFNYSAPTSEERKEIESIRASYINESPASEKLLKLRKLDQKVKSTPIIVSLAVGIVSILIFGLGLTMILEWKLVLWGVLVGAVGLVPMLFAYPIYSFLDKRLKNRYSKEIIKLSDELLNDGKKEV